MQDINNGRAVLEDGYLQIQIALDTLPTWVIGAYDAGAIECKCKVTDLQEFAEELVRALNDEGEDGMTPIFSMFDAALNEVLEQGGFGLEIEEDEED